MSGGGAKNSSARLLPPIKNPLFNPNEDSDEVRVTSVVGFTLILLKFIFLQVLKPITAFISYRTVILIDLVRVEG